MTFDEANKIVEAFDEDPELEDWMPDSKVYEIIEGLRKEYAPTVEMTKDKVKEVNSIVHEVGEEFEQDELPDDIRTTDKMIELESGFVLLKYLNVILHPETIKIVDE